MALSKTPTALKPTTGIGMTSTRTRERMLTRLREQGIKDEIVLHAMGEIPRHIFVDEALSTRAYEDVSLPIGYSQTISQPYIVARMTEILRNGKQLNKCYKLAPAAATKRQYCRALQKRYYR